MGVAGSDNAHYIDGFIKGLKSSKNIYAQCPHCSNLFSLYNARLVYGKSPPKDALSESEKRLKKMASAVAEMQDQFDEAEEDWSRQKDEMDYKWRSKMDLSNSDHAAKVGNLNEKLRHLKSDVAAANKEIIQEKVDRALRSSRNTIEGHIAELFPMFHKTKVNPADLCSLIPTQPMDFVVFNGLFQKQVTSITFLDVKKGGSRLSPVQKSIKDSVNDGKVDFKTIRVNFDKVRGTAKEES